MPALFLTEADVEQLVAMPEAVEVVEEAFRQWGAGRAMNVPRRRAIASGFMLHSLSATAEYLGYAGWKNYTTTRHGAKFHVAIYSLETGEMVALMEADHLGRLRTGAASGVATKFLSRVESKTVGVFGTGRQARTQIDAICCVRPIERIQVFGRDAEKARKFAAELTTDHRVNAVVSTDPEEVVADKDIVITATSAKDPLFAGGRLSPGTHLNLIGCNQWLRTEVDRTTVELADEIVCDSIEQCRLEAGDFRASIEAGAVRWEQMHELKDVVAGSSTPRSGERQITLFKSVGLGLEDVALAARVYQRATEQSRGTRLPF